MPMIGAARARLASQAGFTLVELLVAMAIGMVVLSAALGTVAAMARQSDKTSDRIGALQEGRRALADTTRTLRAMSCNDDVATPLIFASTTRVSFWADLDADPSLQPKVWQIGLEGAGTERSVVLRRYAADGSLEQARTLLEHYVESPAITGPDRDVRGTLGLFAYFAQGEDDPAAPYASPLSEAQRLEVARIEVNLGAQPTNRRQASTTVNLQGTVYPLGLDFGPDTPYFRC